MALRGMEQKLPPTDIGKLAVLKDHKVELLGQPDELLGELEGKVVDDIAVCLGSAAVSGQSPVGYAGVSAIRRCGRRRRKRARGQGI